MYRTYGARDFACYLSQPLRAGLTCGAPTVLSEEAGPRAGREVQRKMPGLPTHVVGTPGKGNRDTEGVPHNSGVPLTSFRIKSPFEAQGRPALRGESRR
jgi:hypothetical protein